jgi:aspartate/methionine/tyrosine aminotransferase
VIAGFVHEPLLQTDAISEDAKRRVLEFKAGCNSPIGAYTQNSKGWTHVRNSVAKFIEERDNIPADPENIFLTNGASEGVRTAFQTLIRNPHDGILVPIPQYPLYSALLTLNNGQLLTYYLNEDEGWTLDAEALE